MVSVVTVKNDPEASDQVVICIPVSKQILKEHPEHVAEDLAKLAKAAALEWVEEHQPE